MRGTNPRKQGLLRLIVPTLAAFQRLAAENRVTTTVADVETPVRLTVPDEMLPTVPEPAVKTTVRDATGPASDHVSVWFPEPAPDDTMRVVSVGYPIVKLMLLDADDPLTLKMVTVTT
jgi:hypothetical protein